jgi:hypothetical protein
VQGLSDLGYGEEFDLNTDSYVTLLLSARKALMQSLTDNTAFASENSLAYTLLNDLISSDGATDMLDFTQLQGSLDGIVETLDFKQAAQKAIDNGNADAFGENLTQGLADGITTNSSTVSDTMNTIRDNTLAALNSAFEIESPSKLMARQGAYIPAGLANGINQGAALAYAAMNAMLPRRVSQAVATARAMSSAFAANLSFGASSGSTVSGSTGTNYEAGVKFGDVYVNSQTDAEVLAARISKLTQRKKAGYGSK